MFNFVSTVYGGIFITYFDVFSGFMIKLKDYPDFWVFMYWLNPMHYALEGLVVTQFNRDSTPIVITGTIDSVSASTYVANFYSDWKFSSRGYDILALCLFIIFNR